ncbi:MAG: PfkB family carbohydrate kinase [Muribaculaceae bacterium]|nr:PfkB family carbohydrate kinase [Muribaculaceae bacterium]
MRKIITIAESVLDTEYRNGQPVRSFVGGRIPCAAASLAMAGIPTFMVSESTNDAVGDIIVDYLNRHKVNTSSIDRYPDGATAFSAIFKNEDGTSSIVSYGRYPQERFNVMWPRIDKDDIVIIGSLYSVDQPQRERLFELLTYADERKAIIVYLPGLQHGQDFRITRLMPNILENLEISNIVIAHQQDIATIFPKETAEAAYRNHIGFYCDTFLHITPELDTKRFAARESFDHKAPQATKPDNWLGWQAGFTAGLVYMLLAKAVTHDSLRNQSSDTWNEIINEAYAWAQASTGNDNCIDEQFAASKTNALSVGDMLYEKLKELEKQQNHQ